MKVYLIFLLLSFGGLHSCSDTNTPDDFNNCLTSTLNNNSTYNDLITNMPEEVITALAEVPDENGALGRNKNGYFHVRFQLSMTHLSDYAIKFEDEQALSEYLKNLIYSFSYQTTAGDFDFMPPNALLEDPEYEPPSEANLASGTAFFAYSLGLSLHALNQSDWYQGDHTATSIKNEIKALNPKMQNMLAYLKQSVALLNLVDEHAPNRLLFNAIAFYTLGEHLKDEEAKNIGISFAQKALSQRNDQAGYFIEAGDWIQATTVSP